jgi:hypothetical protein
MMRIQAYIRNFGCNLSCSRAYLLEHDYAILKSNADICSGVNGKSPMSNRAIPTPDRDPDGTPDVYLAPTPNRVWVVNLASAKGAIRTRLSKQQHDTCLFWLAFRSISR